MMTLTAEKCMLTREIHRLERMVKMMKETNKLGNAEETLRFLRGRYQEIEKEQKEEKAREDATLNKHQKKNTADSSRQ